MRLFWDFYENTKEAGGMIRRMNAFQTNCIFEQIVSMNEGGKRRDASYKKMKKDGRAVTQQPRPDTRIIVLPPPSPPTPSHIPAQQGILPTPGLIVRPIHLPRQGGRAMSLSGRRDPLECWTCGGPHFAAYCPERREGQGKGKGKGKGKGQDQGKGKGKGKGKGNKRSREDAGFGEDGREEGRRGGGGGSSGSGSGRDRAPFEKKTKGALSRTIIFNIYN